MPVVKTNMDKQGLEQRVAVPDYSNPIQLNASMTAARNDSLVRLK